MVVLSQRQPARALEDPMEAKIIAQPETAEQRFMHECMRLMTFVQIAECKGCITGDDSFTTTWDAWHKVMVQYRQCAKTYEAAFREPKTEPAANDNQ